MKKITLAALIAFTLFTGCKKNPVQMLLKKDELCLLNRSLPKKSFGRDDGGAFYRVSKNAVRMLLKNGRALFIK